MAIKIEDIRDQLDYNFVYSGINFQDLILMTLDNKYYLYRIEHPPSPIFIGSLIKENFDIQDIAFYGDYLSYMHDVPMVYTALSNKNSSPTKPLTPISSSEFTNNDYCYYENLKSIYDSLVDMRFNGSVKFRWEEAYYESININLPETIIKSRKEIQLYSMGLKQTDPLSEFLCYYRVIESISRNNGKSWIDKKLEELEPYDFGFLELTGFWDNNHREENIETNIFSIYREKAISRLKHLKSSLDITIGKYLYNEIRCGIAHGKESVKIYDNGSILEEIALDTYIMKLLARMAIETNINR
ncbi:MAG: hypothetical protein JEZ01_07695 [Labilibaculum sp.]|nr:methylamine utilization protein MauJ [Labilibaculum sp.]MBI9057643.1 hypothetical protein [Labilibaculum sp.]